MAQTEPRRRNTLWYLAAVIIMSAGLAAGSVMVWRGFVMITHVEQFIGPGHLSLEVAAPGDYTLWHDYHAVFEGRTYSTDKQLPDGVSFRIKGPNGPVEVKNASGATATMGNTERVAVAAFVAHESGPHEIVAEGEFPARVFSVGEGNFFKSFGMIFGGIGAIILSFCTGLGLGAWVYFKNNASGDEGKQKESGMANPVEGELGEPEHSAKQLATLVYALQAASYLVGITFIAAVIVNYVKRQEVAGTWLESHFLWQIRTFWWSFLWGVLGVALMVVVVGIFILIADAIWVLYRIVKGWLNLNDGKAMYE